MFSKIDLLIPETKKTISILVKNEDLQLTKKFFNKRWIIALKTEPFSEDTKSFWIIEIKFKVEENEIYTILPAKKLKNWLEIINDLNIKNELTYINNILTPLDEDKIFAILQEIKQLEKTTEKKTKAQKRSISNKDQEKLIKFIDDITSEWEKILKKAHWAISPMEIKKIEDQIAELKKLKRSTNFDKIKLLIESVLEKLEETELKILEYHKKLEQQKVISDSLSDLELLPEISKYKRAQKVKNLKWKNINLWFLENLYKNFWKPFLFLVLLAKEIRVKFNFLNKYTHSFKNYLELTFLFLLVEICLFMVYKLSLSWNFDFKNTTNLQNLWGYFYYLAYIWVYWLVFYILKFFIKKDHFVSFVIFFVLSLIIWFIVKYLTFSTFALPN